VSDADFGQRRAEGMAKWAAVRARGRLRFVLVWGVGVWGGLMFVLMGLGFGSLMMGAKALTPPVVAVSALLWFGGGALFGFGAWKFNENLFNKFRATQAGNDA
jgi:hypothetical protein